MKKLVIHLLSDSSGNTVKKISKAAISQFQGVEVKEYNWPMIRDFKELDICLNKIKEKPGIILYTISNKDIRESLKATCYKMQLPCISVVGHVIKAISQFTGIYAENTCEYGNRFDSDYVDKLEAIEYTLKHDDGQMLNDLEEAEIVIIGPSRTSKTPTSIYLSYNGFKTANIPYVAGHDIENYLRNLKLPLIVGLVASPAIISEVRGNRISIGKYTGMDSYIDLNIIKKECAYIKNLCSNNNWSIVDVSNKSIEEVSALIMKMFYDRKKYTTVS